MRAASLLAWRSLSSHFSRTLLSVTGVVLGVALFLSIVVTIRSLEHGVDVPVKGTFGDAALMVGAFDKSGQGLAPGVVAELTNVPGVAQVLPQVEGTTGATAGGGFTAIHFVAADLAAEASAHTYRLVSGDASGLVLEEGFAGQHGLSTGMSVTFDIAGRRLAFPVTGLMAAEGLAGPVGGANALIPLAQFPAAPTRILLVPAPGASIGRAVQAALPANAKALDTYNTGNADIPGGFSRQLGFFSAVAALVAGFLIFSIFSLSLQERTVQTGMVLAIGATPGQMAGALLLEAAGLGLAGGLGGVPAGLGLSWAAMQLVSASLGRWAPRPVLFQPADLVLGLVIGLGVSLVAAAWPVLRASRMAPVEAIRSGGRAEAAGGRRTAVIGLVLAAASLAVWFFITRGEQASGAEPLVAGYFVGVALAMPLLVQWGVDRLLLPLAGRLGPVMRLAARNVSRHAGRAALTVTSTIVAVALLVGVSSVSASLWGQQRRELDAAGYGDLILRGDLSGEVAAAIRQLPGVESLATAGRIPTTGHLMLKPGASAADVSAEVKRAYPLMRIDDVAAYQAAWEKTITGGIAPFRAILLITLAMAALGIINTLFMNVIAQRRDLALLRAVGATAAQMRTAVVAESVCLGLIGAVLGAAAGSLLAVGFVRTVGGAIPFVYPGAQVAVYLAGTVLLAAFAGLTPAWQAGRVAVTDALRAE